MLPYLGMSLYAYLFDGEGWFHVYLLVDEYIHRLLQMGTAYVNETVSSHQVSVCGFRACLKEVLV